MGGPCSEPAGAVGLGGCREQGSAALLSHIFWHSVLPRKRAEKRAFRLFFFKSKIELFFLMLA